MSNHTITFCQKCGGLIVTPPYSPSETSANYIHVNKACKCAEESAMQSQIVTLREKCAQLEKDVQVARGQYEGACIIVKQLEEKCAELECKLGEMTVKRDIAVQSLELASDNKVAAQKALAMQCAHTKELQHQLEEAAKQETNAAAERMTHDFPTLMEFYRKHGLGPMMPPSCLCCGKRTYPAELGHPQSVAIKHAELPGIVICEDCRTKASTPTNALIEQAKSEEREECAKVCEKLGKGYDRYHLATSHCADAIRARKP